MTIPNSLGNFVVPLDEFMLTAREKKFHSIPLNFKEQIFLCHYGPLLLEKFIKMFCSWHKKSFFSLVYLKFLFLQVGFFLGWMSFHFWIFIWTERFKRKRVRVAWVVDSMVLCCLISLSFFGLNYFCRKGFKTKKKKKICETRYISDLK